MATKLHEGAPGNSLDQIPTEILGEIFKIYMALPRPAELDNLSEHSRDSYIMPSPYVLSLVCASWHAIAVDIPIFWSDIIIYALWDREKNAYTVRENHGRALRAWVSRIRGQTWSLDISVATRNQEDLSPHTPLLDILSSTTIEKLEFLKAPGSIFKNPVGFGSLSFPNLKSLVLNEEGIQQFTTVCPELKEACLLSTGRCNLPWHLLTHLYIGIRVPMTANDFVYVVTHGQRLQHLCISTQTDSMSSYLLPSISSSQSSEAYPTSSLTDLTLINAWPFVIPLPISWPNLKRVRLLTDLSGWIDGYHADNLRLLQSLTHLHISSWKFPTDAKSLLGACHSLTHLHVDIFQDHIFDELTLSLDCEAGSLLPHLESLKFDYRADRDHLELPFPDTFYKMIASRVDPSSVTQGRPWTPLKSLAFQIYHPNYNMPCTLLDELRKGLEVFSGQIDVSLSVARVYRDYVVQTDDGDVDHWDRGFGAVVDALGQF
ncbi:hypothetical protein MD484_g5933, partial [Candolleomyces efflorescens]